MRASWADPEALCSCHVDRTRLPRQIARIQYGGLMTPRTTLPAPIQMTLYVAFPCNLRCKNCWLFGIADVERDYMGTRDKDIMSWETFCAAVDPLFGHGVVPSICFMGGEPTLHPRLAEMIRYIKGLGPSYVDINTNGTR